MKESKCWSYATCHKVTVEHIHMWWCVCDVCFFLISPLTAKRKRTAETSFRHVHFYLMFVDREGERSVVSFVMVYALWFYMGCCLCFDVYSHIMFYR